MIESIVLTQVALTFTLSCAALMELAKVTFEGRNGNTFQFWFNVALSTVYLFLFFRSLKIWWQL
jgi:hypothetical protein